MPLLLLFIVTALSACTANVPQKVEPGEIVRELVFMNTPEVALNLSQSGSTYLGRFASNSALNSTRAFVSDFHGEVRITLHQNKTVECRWWAEGRVTDPTVYEGSNGFLEAYSSLCAGKLQRDGSFEFQGAYISDGPGEELGDETFTLRGNASDEFILGTLQVGGLLSNSKTLADPSSLLEEEEGIKFEAVIE